GVAAGEGRRVGQLGAAGDDGHAAGRLAAHVDAVEHVVGGAGLGLVAAVELAGRGAEVGVHGLQDLLDGEGGVVGHAEGGAVGADVEGAGPTAGVQAEGDGERLDV